MRRTTPTLPALVLPLLALAGVVAPFPGCGSTVGEGTGGAATGGGAGSGSGAVTGPPSASSGHVASSSSSVTGSGGGGGGGTGGGGGGTCSATEKVCDGTCVAVDDPAYGCTPTSCTACPAYPNASQACMAGTCALGACDPGFKDCDGDPANGCETNLQNDPANCGACAPCVNPPHATAACEMGVCGMATCDPGWTDCNNDPVDGCEANLGNDPMNCGSCGSACPVIQGCQPGGCYECVAGGCEPPCALGLTNCLGDPPDTCATMLGTNKNCNGCGDTCNLANATSQCMPSTVLPPPAFVCTLQMCNAGFADCDKMASNGCETDTDTDPDNCGGCGQTCTTTCSGGVCAP